MIRLRRKPMGHWVMGPAVDQGRSLCGGTLWAKSWCVIRNSTERRAGRELGVERACAKVLGQVREQAGHLRPPGHPWGLITSTTGSP